MGGVRFLSILLNIKENLMGNISNKNFGWIEGISGSYQGAAIGNAIGGKKGREIGSTLGGAIAGMFDDYLVLFLDKEKKADCEMVKTISESKACDTVRTNNPGSNYKAFVYPREYRQVSKYIEILNRSSKGVSPRLQLYLDEVENLMNPKPLSAEVKIVLGILGGAAIAALLYAGSRAFSMQELILEKAFSGGWVSSEEIKAFGEDYQKGFGRVERALSGITHGATVGGTIGLAGGPITALPSAGIGAAVGALVGAGTDRYQVVFLNEEGDLDSTLVTAVSKNMARKIVEMRNRKGSGFEVFRFPEEIVEIDKYVQKVLSVINRKKK